MKIALVHDWLITRGGAERVLEEIYRLFPAPIYTLLKGKGFSELEPIHTSFLQRIPGATRAYRNMLPLFPSAIQSFDLSKYDLILSSSFSVAKGVRKREGQLHVCYCHTPMRYAWDLEESYLGDVSVMKRVLARPFLKRIREWDRKTDGVDHFIANSRFVAKRIETLYGRESIVVYPPVKMDNLQWDEKREEFYLVVSRLVSYKKVGMIVEAFARMPDKKLVVVGDGPERKQIPRMPNVEMMGWQSDEVVRKLMQKAKGFIFAAIEDFGIVLVEAQAAGCPVIAYGEGGALESVVEGKTGLFFREQTKESLCEAVERFGCMQFDPAMIRAHAEQFDKSYFREKYKQVVLAHYESHCSSGRSGA